MNGIIELLKILLPLIGLMVFVAGIAIFIRYFLYRKELTRFLNGEIENTNSKIHLTQTLDLPIYNFQQIHHDIKDIIQQHNMISVRSGSQYCCFTRIIADLPIKIVISVPDDEVNKNITFDFYDRYLQAIMTNRLRTRFNRRMDRIYNEFSFKLEGLHQKPLSEKEGRV